MMAWASAVNEDADRWRLEENDILMEDMKKENFEDRIDADPSVNKKLSLGN
jgi:hypothetical protein